MSPLALNDALDFSFVVVLLFFPFLFFLSPPFMRKYERLSGEEAADHAMYHSILVASLITLASPRYGLVWLRPQLACSSARPSRALLG